MNYSHQIEIQLEKILDTGHNILDVIEQNEPELKTVQKLFAQRGRQLQTLDDTQVNTDEFTKEQIEELRNLFTRIHLLEKKINNIFAKLSLKYGNALKEIDLHKKAKKTYTASVITSKFLNARVNG